MNILVCVKQVPDTEEIKPNASGEISLAGVPTIVNPFDGYALETAALLKDKDASVKITVLSVGEADSETALKACLAVGADKGVLVNDAAAAGAGPFAAAQALAGAVKKLEAEDGPFSLIFCGAQSADGENAQTGPQLAQLLGLPSICYGVEVEPVGEDVVVKREATGGYVKLAAKMPAVVTITQPFYEPRYPTIKSKMAAKKAAVPAYSAADLGVSPAAVTNLVSAFPPAKRKAGVRVSEGSPEADGAKLVKLLSDAALI